MRALKGFLSELDNQKIKVILIDSPINPYIKDLYDPEAENNFINTIKDCLNPYQKIYELAFKYPKSDFIDFNHLNHKGRRSFSEDLTEIIKENDVF